MIVVVGHFRLPLAALDEGRAEMARTQMARVVMLSRAEPGCIAYDYAADLLEPGLFRVSERWTSRAALADHFASAHMAEWKAACDSLGMTDRQVTAYETGSGEPL